MYLHFFEQYYFCSFGREAVYFQRTSNINTMWNGVDGEAMLALTRRAIAQANEIDHRTSNDDPDTLAKLETNDPTLKGIVIGPRVETLSYVLKKRAKPEKYLPTSKDEWVRVGEYIGAHEHIEDLELYLLDSEDAIDIENLLKGVANNRSIKNIKFVEAYPAMFESVIAVLSPFFKHNTNLRQFDVSCCHLSVPFKLVATILREGSTLEKFCSFDDPDTSDLDWIKEIDRILCDTSSIEATRQSNHCLSKLSVYKDTEDGYSQRRVPFPAKLEKSLELNKNENKTEVAEEKVQCYHESAGGKGKKRERELGDRRYNQSDA